MQTYEEICDYSRDYNFAHEQIDASLQYVIYKFEHASLVMGEKNNVKSDEAKTQLQYM